MFVGYLLGWDGYATLQQPVSSDVTGCDGVGIADLILPSRIAKVDACIARNWNRNSDCCPNCNKQSSDTPGTEGGTEPFVPAPTTGGNPIGSNTLPGGGTTLV